jgi:hypothetical protein
MNNVIFEEKSISLILILNLFTYPTIWTVYCKCTNKPNSDKAIKASQSNFNHLTRSDVLFERKLMFRISIYKRQQETLLKML